MIREILLNKWFFIFIAAWIIFLLLVDWRMFTKNVWGGIVASGLEFWQDATAIHVGMYFMQDTGIALLKVSIFFTFGIIFTMGILFMQFLSENPKLQLIHIITFSIGFIIFECILTSYGLLVKLHWSLIGSFLDNLIIFGSLTWIKQYILSKTKTE